MTRWLDLKGKRFGRLVVEEKTNLRDGTSIVWKCRCDCGNVSYVSSKNLLHSGTSSCGCLRKERAKENLSGDPRPKLGIVNHTNLSKIASSKPQRNSNTGVRGVTRLPDGRLEAFINVKGKRIRIGRYFTLMEAQTEREKAVERYYKPLLEGWKIK